MYTHIHLNICMSQLPVGPYSAAPTTTEQHNRPPPIPRPKANKNQHMPPPPPTPLPTY